MDFARSKIMLIPKEITKFIESLENDRDSFTDADKELIAELLENEIIHDLSPGEEELFPKLDLAWDYPAEVSNAVIEITKENVANLQLIFDELESLNCFYYSIIVSNSLSDEELEVLYHCLYTCSILNFELTLNYFKSEKLDEFISACRKLPRLSNKVTVFNCYDAVFRVKFKEEVEFREASSVINSCGCIRKENFNCNLHIYTESLKHNTCLNRKVSIDGAGNIKNCLSVKQNFGNIKKDKIKDVLGMKEFKKYWNIKKDDIEVCRDCEFRNICTDCRAFIEDPENIYSKPLKCGYSPYNNTWEEWSKNPLKNKTIMFYGLNKKS